MTSTPAPGHEAVPDALVAPTTGPGPEGEQTPQDVARSAVAAVLDLHVTTSRMLPVAHLAEITQAVQTLAVLVRDITQDLHVVATNYRLDAGGIPHEDLDLRRQAGVTGADAAGKYAQGVELLHQATAWLQQARDDATLMAELNPDYAPRTTDAAPARSRPERNGAPPNDHAGRPAVEHDEPAL